MLAHRVSPCPSGYGRDHELTDCRLVGVAGAEIGRAELVVAVYGGLTVTVIPGAPSRPPNTKISCKRRLNEGARSAPLSPPLVSCILWFDSVFMNACLLA